MNLFGKDLDKETVVVAEIGVNHEGSADAARKLVDLAADAGADAVKFQSYTPARYASASDPARLARVTNFALDLATHHALAEQANARGICFFSTPLTEDWVAPLAEFCPAIKIASGDISFEPTVRAAGRSGKPVILSTGLATLDEIDTAVAWLTNEIGHDQLSDRLVIMQCISAYPTPVEEANTAVIPTLRERYGVTVGYSNHVIGPEACYAAVALGAKALEVHFTHQKSGREFRDHELSFEPDDLASLVAIVPKIRSSLGTGNKMQLPSELGNLAAVRKGVVAARSLSAGTSLSAEDLMYARPATAFASGDIETVIGRKLQNDKAEGELIELTDVSAGQVARAECGSVGFAGWYRRKPHGHRIAPWVCWKPSMRVAEPKP